MAGNATADCLVAREATALLQQAGIGIGGSVLTAGSSGVMGVQGSHNYGSQSSAYGSGGGERSTRNFCSVALPDRRPFASRDVPVAERLFIVAHPDTFDNDILEDVFCRFGNMIGAYFMPGKKFGYVKYASSESARKAMDVLHGEVVCGSRLKVLPAEPMRRRTDDASKRDHSTGGSSIADDDEIAAPRGKHSRYD